MVRVRMPGRAAAVCSVAAVCLWGASLGSASEPRAWTLDEAIAEAFARNLALARGSMEVRRSELEIERAQSAFDITGGPLLRVDSLAGDRLVTYGAEASKPLRLTGASVGVSATQSDREEGLEGAAGGNDGRSHSSISVSVNQPLFRRFGRAVAEEPIRLAGDLLRAEQRRWEQQKSDLVLELVTVFETMARCDAQAGFEEAHRQRLDRLAALVRARERQGRATRADVLRLELQRGETETRLTNVLERRSMNARRLAELLGAAEATEFRIEPPPGLEMELPGAEDAMATALANRMDYAQARDDAATARRQADLARRNRMPDVNLALSVRRDAADQFGRMLEEGDTYTSLDARTGGFPWRRADRIAQLTAELQDASAEASVDIRRQSIAREVLQALAEIRRADAERVIAERNRRLAADSARVSRRLYETGRMDDFALADAEQSLAAAENRGFEAGSEALLARYKLMHTLGLLVQHPPALCPSPEPEA
ncbi:MAG: TolC family protein [Kiritimatiellae bacterium]|nr:TolC family protein [Kiritimatiellia bacterium]